MEKFGAKRMGDDGCAAPLQAEEPRILEGCSQLPRTAQRWSGATVFLGLVVTGWLSSTATRAEPEVPARLRFEQISVEQGLPQQSVLSVLQDRQGFLWFATQGGLVRFDGYRMRIFRHDPEESGSLASNRVWTLFEDSRGILWAGTAEGGLNRFDAETETFTAFRHDPADPHSIASDRIWDVHEGPDGRLWISTSSGLSAFDLDTGLFTNALPGDELRAVLEAGPGAPEGALWIATSRRGLVLFHPDRGQLGEFRHDSEADPSSPNASLPDDQVYTLHRDSAGALWVGTAGGLARYDEASGSFHVMEHDPNDGDSLAGPMAQTISEDRSGRLWIGTDRGLSLLDRSADRFRNFLADPSRPGSLPHRSVASLFQDRAGILWVGTWYGGVAKVDPRNWPFERYLRGADPRRSPTGGVVALHEGSDRVLWVGTSEGLCFFDLETGEWSAPASVRQAGDIAGLAPGPEVGQTWVAYSWGELELWESSAGGARAIPLGSGESRRRYIHALHRDPSGSLWIGHGGLLELAPGPRWTRYTHRPGDPTSLAPSGIKTLADGREGALWIGYSDRGLARLLPGERGLEHHSLYAGKVGQPSVSAILDTGEGPVWVGTNAGLFRLELEADSGGPAEVRALTTRHGLPSDLIQGILPGEDGRLWLSTAAGLTVFDPETETFRSFGAADGTIPGGYNPGAALRTQDGRMIFGGSAGMTLFHPAEIRRDPSPPALVLTHLRLRNERVEPGGEGPLSRPIHLAREVVLGPEDDLVSFEFAALHFANPGANRFAYRLEGFDDGWISTGADHRLATYTDLPPGSYTLRVKGSNADGAWNEKGLELRVRVLPPWWRTRWAYLLYALSFGGLLSGLVLANRRLEALVQKRTAEVRSQARALKEEHDAKARFIANVSHEIRTPLTLTLGPLEDLRVGEADQLSEAGRQSLEMAFGNAQRLMGLVGQVLDFSRLEEGRVRLQPVHLDLAGLIRQESSRFELEARRRGVAFEVELPDRPLLLPADREAMGKVVSNLLSNAVKFTGEGEGVRVRLEEKGSELILRVSDTGRGIDARDVPRIFDRYYQGSQTVALQPGTGIGLSLVRELVELHGGRVAVQSQLGEGSVFTVILPTGGSATEDSPAQVPAVAGIGMGGGAGGAAAGETTGGTSGNGSGPGAAEAASLEDLRQTVLLVDDNPELRLFLALRLTAAYRVLQAENGEEALAAMRRELPDLVVSDVVMPTLDGFEMTRRIRQDPEIAFIPVLLLTAKATGEDTLEGFESGADDYLTKPFDGAELAARIAALLTSRRRLGEHLRKELEPRPERRESFEQRVRRVIAENLHDPGFSVGELAATLAVDRTTLFRKVRRTFGVPPSELLRQMRLERAAELLRAGEGNVTEVCHAAGFPSLSYFGKRFRERYGVPPSRFGRT